MIVLMLLLIAGPVILAMWVVPYSASVFISVDKNDGNIPLTGAELGVGF
jgi:hypothetical protein